jgi:hypothetical protein
MICHKYKFGLAINKLNNYIWQMPRLNKPTLGYTT